MRNLSSLFVREVFMKVYEAPFACAVFVETEDVLSLDLLLASSENDETDNETSIDDLLGGLL